jgi:hypothetical protein
MGGEYDAMRSLEARMAALEGKQRHMADDVMRLKLSMDSNTTALTEFIELGKNLKFGIKVLGFVESTAVWITKVALAGGTLWGIWKFIILETVKQRPPGS